LADPASDEELGAQRQKQLRRVRQGSPEKHMRTRTRHEDELEIVNRQANGSYLLDTGVGVQHEAFDYGMMDDLDDKEAESRVRS
jgi:hypothetical protein